MKKKAHMTFGLKMVLLAVGMGITLSVAALVIGSLVFNRMNVAFYGEIGNAMAYTLVEEVAVEEMDRYFAYIDLEFPENTPHTFQPDKRYREIQDHLRDLQAHTVASDIYVGRAVDGLGMVLLFDSSEDNVPLGSVYMSDAFSQHFNEMLRGVALSTTAIVDPDDPDYGMVLTLAVPFYREGGDPAGYYVMVDVPATTIIKTQSFYLTATAVFVSVLTLIFVGIYLLVIRASFIKPLKQITQAVQSGGAGGGPKAFDGLKLKGNYELQTLSENFRNLLLEIEEQNRRQQDLAVREQALKNEMDLANDLNIAVLPKQLPQREEAYPFRVRGLIRRGEGLDICCCFYDYFLLPGDRLCVMVGEVPGEGVPQALFTVMAQAAMKSRLMSDLSLVETMTSANRQLYEMSGNMYLNVLVGILDGITGSFSCINAGLSAPLLMRSQERYEPLSAFSYASLGKNENVVYRVEEFQLRQGDRLFFYSEDADGDRDSGERLCRILNEAKLRRAGPEAQLQMLESAAVQGQVSGRAMLALEYLRRDKARAHCVITADAAGAAALQNFLREQLWDNQIDEHRMARFIVLGDELFALCRQGADGNFLAECAVRQDTVMLRVRGDMGGRNPLTAPTGGPAGLAAEYIRRNCEEASFVHDDFTDTVTLVKRV